MLLGDSMMNKPTIQQYIEQGNGDAVYLDPVVITKATEIIYRYKHRKRFGDISEFDKWVLAENLIYLSHFIETIILHEKLFCLELFPEDSSTEFSVIDNVAHAFSFSRWDYPSEVQKCVIDYSNRIASFTGIQKMTDGMGGATESVFWDYLIRDCTVSLGIYFRLMEAGISCTCDPYFSEFAVPFIKETYKGKSFSDICMSVMNAAMKEKALRLNEIRKAPIYNTSIPMLFAKVLSLSSTPKDLLSHALEIRNTKEARRFQEWASAVNNDSSLDNFEKEYNEVDKLAKNLAKGIRRPTKEVSIGFGIGLLSFSTSFSVPYIKLRRKKHLSFLSDNCWKAYCMEEIASGLTRVFNIDGKDIIRRLSLFQEIRPVTIARYRGMAYEDNRGQP